MDPFTAFDSFSLCLELTKGLIIFIQDAKNAKNEKQKVKSEAAHLFVLLDLIYGTLNTSSDKSVCPEGLRTLDAADGPLEEYNDVLRNISTNTSGTKWAVIKWSKDKKEVESLLRRMERLKSHLNAIIALDNFKLSTTLLDKMQELSYNMRSIEKLDWSALLEWNRLSIHKRKRISRLTRQMNMPFSSKRMR